MHEDLLRHIWSRQMFDRSHLSTTDGQSLNIIDPGRLSRISGPDFRDASVEIDGILYSGDIEFHRNIDDWELHRHHQDQQYNTVILHVVLHGTAAPTRTHSGRTIPTVILEPYLTSSISSIADHLSREEHSSRRRRIACGTVNAGVSAEHLLTWITSLYRERLNEKSKRMHSRLQEIILRMQRNVGEPQSSYVPTPDDLPLSFDTLQRSEYHRRQAWEQLFYEEIMDCLGYSNNRAPMKQLAELVPLTHIRSLLTPGPDADPDSFTPAVIHIEAILFRASGLLPSIDEISNTGSKVFLHSLSAAAKELRAVAPHPFIHHTAWNFSPTRPANFPTIRIAAGSVVVFNILYRSLVRSIITVIEGRHSSVQSKIGQLCALLDAGEHPFWNDHYSFSEGTQSKHSVLGKPRIFDILVNALIPFVYVYSRIFPNDHLAEQCLNIAAELPLLEENSVLQTMRSELLKGKIELSFAYQQQGLLQLYKQYCITGRCSECSIGKEVMVT